MSEHRRASSADERPERAQPAPARPQRSNRLLMYAIVLGVVFLLGFVPQYLKVRELNGQLETLQWRDEVGTARDLIALTLQDLSSNNFGLASQRASQFFNQVRSMSSRAPEPATRELLGQIAGRRDAITAGLAKADPATRSQVQRIFEEVHTKIGQPPTVD